LYWINGKAGSDKSTLMKYLIMHDKTKSALEKWAGWAKLLLSSFSFGTADTSYNGHKSD